MSRQRCPRNQSTARETAAVLATARDINEIAEAVSLRRADTGEILTGVAVDAFQPAAATEYPSAGFTDDESGE